MRKRLITTGIWVAIGLLTLTTNVYSQKSAPLSPMDQGSWVFSGGVGAATTVFGNGYGFGPGFKFFVENGTFKLGPGVLTLGGEMGFSFFSDKFLGFKESWYNIMFGARSAYHYGWNVPGLDTYGGIPLGIGFSVYSHSSKIHYRGYHAVYPYLGLFLGTSYFFNNLVGINGEVGYNVTYANLGVIFRIN
jgi:hypothetical protein